MADPNNKFNCSNIKCPRYNELAKIRTKVDFLPTTPTSNRNDYLEDLKLFNSQSNLQGNKTNNYNCSTGISVYPHPTLTSLRKVSTFKDSEDCSDNSEPSNSNGFQVNVKVKANDKYIISEETLKTIIKEFPSYGNYLKSIIILIDNYLIILKDKRGDIDKSQLAIAKVDALKILDDILNSFSESNRGLQYEKFLEKLVKGHGGQLPKNTAASLLYFFLIKNRIIIDKSSIIDLFSIDRHGFFDNVKSIFDILIEIPNYEYIYDTILAYQLTQTEYEKILIYYINKFQELLFSNSLLSTIIKTERESEFIFSIYRTILNSIKDENKFQEFYSKLHKLYKSPKQIAANICYIYLLLHKDVALANETFIKILNFKETVNLNLNHFTHSLRYFLETFFEEVFDINVYKQKVFDYFKFYHREIVDWYSTHSESEEKIKQYHKILELKPILKNAESLFKISLENGFKPLLLESATITQYFTPQVMALSLIYFSFKMNDNLIELANKKTFQHFFNKYSIEVDPFAFDSICNTTINRLYPFVKDFIGRWYGQVYDRGSFIKELEKISFRHDYPEAKLLLNLYKITKPDLGPNEFVEALGIYGSLKQLIQNLWANQTFKIIDTFKKMKIFAQDPNLIPNRVDRENALQWILELQSLRTYNRESFIEKLRSSIQDFYSIDTEFLLLLYEATDYKLEPSDFARQLDIYGGDLYNLIHGIIENKRKFTEPETFRKIQTFIVNNISPNNQNKLLTELRKIQVLRREDFVHRGVQYNFHWIKSHLSQVKDIVLRDNLIEYLSNIENQKFPIDIFDDPKNPRSSDLQFVGDRELVVQTEVIEKFFKGQYLKDITDIFGICNNVKSVVEKYRIEKIGKYPDHPPILGYILMHNDNAFAIEIPVWRPIKNTKNFYIGHIDLLLTNGTDIIIADYKPSQSEVFKAIPQVTSYALMLRDRLCSLGFEKDFNIRCVIFTKNIALEFNPEEITNVILEFIKHEKERSGRKEDLLIKGKGSSLSREMEKLRMDP